MNWTEPDPLSDRLSPDDPVLRPEVDSPADAAYVDAYRWFARATAAFRRAVREADAADAQTVPDVPGYALLGELGEGGFGTVYLARQAALGRLVAVKLLRPDRGIFPDVLARFDRERLALAALRHPNILGVIDAGEADGQRYLVTEYAAGGSLRQYMRQADDTTGSADPGESPRRSRPVLWPEADAVRLVATLARAADAAHRQQYVHRDLKPENVLVWLPRDEPGPDRVGMLPPGAVPKIADFGLVKLLAGDPEAETESYEPDAATPAFARFGTPRYMAPEQFRGETAAAGPAADVWRSAAFWPSW